MELSINTKNTKVAFHKAFAVLGLLLIASITGLFLSMPIPIPYKLSLVLLPGIVFIFLAVNPFLTLCMIFLLRPELALFQESGLLKIFTGLILIFAFFVFTTRKDRIAFCWDRLKYLYIFILVSITSLIYTVNYMTSFVFILKIFSFIAIYLLVFNLIKSTEEGIKLLSYFPICTILPLIYGFYQYFSGQVYIMKSTGIERFASFFGLANGYARFLLFILLPSIALFAYINSKQKKYLFLVLLSIIITIAMLGVRTVWIALSFSILILLYFLPKFRKHLISILLLASLFCLPVAITGFEAIVSSDFQIKKTSTLQTRINVWTQLINRAVVKKPFLGFGVGTSQEVAATEAHIALMPHNDYLRILVDTGLLGFIPYMLFLISNLIYFYKSIAIHPRNRYLNICAFTLFSSFIVMMLAENIFYYTGCIWYLLGYLAITHKLNYLTDPKLA